MGSLGTLQVLLLLAIVLQARPALKDTCNGTVDFYTTYTDGQINSVQVDGGSPPTDTVVVDAPTSPQLVIGFVENAYAGENGIEIERHHQQLIPGGRAGLYGVHLFEYFTNTWRFVDVYCQPLGLAYRRVSDEVVGHCSVNTTAMCIPYFKLRYQTNTWVDVSQPGLCSQRLSTNSLTNAVILQSYDNEFEADAVKLFSAEKWTNKVHEISLSRQGATYYSGDPTLRIDHLVPVHNESLLGLRVTYQIINSSDLYHHLFSWQVFSSQPETGFVGESVQTESVAFDSYNLQYLVSFNANHDTVIITENGTSTQHQVLVTLDDPITCLNIAEPDTHYLICPTKENGSALLINVTTGEVTSQIIPVGMSQITKLGKLSQNVFYILNNINEFSVYVIASGCNVACLGTYAIRPSKAFSISAATSNVTCSANDANDDDTDGDSRLRVIVISVSIASVLIALIVTVVMMIIYRKRLLQCIRSCKHSTEDTNMIPPRECTDRNTLLAPPVLSRLEPQGSS